MTREQISLSIVFSVLPPSHIQFAFSLRYSRPRSSLYTELFSSLSSTPSTFSPSFLLLSFLVSAVTFSFLLFGHSRYLPPSRSNSHSNISLASARSLSYLSFYISFSSLSLSLFKAGRKAATADRAEQKKEENSREGHEEKSVPTTGWWLKVHGDSPSSFLLHTSLIGPSRSFGASSTPTMKCPYHGFHDPFSCVLCRHEFRDDPISAQTQALSSGIP